MDRMAILAKTQKRHEGKSEREQPPPPPLLRESVFIDAPVLKHFVHFTMFTCHVQIILTYAAYHEFMPSRNVTCLPFS